MREFIAEAKAKYRQVIGTQINEVFFVWRPLTRQEYEYVLSLSENEEEFNINLCSMAVLYPEIQDYSTAPAGFIDSLAPLIKDFSGYGDFSYNKNSLESYRDKLNNDFVTQAETIIMMAFPNYTPDQMKTWEADKLWDMTARAEWVLQKRGLSISVEMEEPKQEEVKPNEKGMDLYVQGYDPMILLDPLDVLKFDKDYIEWPFISIPEWEEGDFDE